ncbi:hypothetical protein Zmor_012023 [Zophobas morio]|uniref:Toprim domain-containing protein n=1 Tax=Zophobas morio TaxID=2755281 RepID=A0AA38HIT5_9CUCU|nr:hypothetical protein Zmor_012023 [Zophobas morio]
MKFQEIILVEGKGDVERIKQAFPNDEIDFLISHGLGFNEKLLELCRQANESRGLIVFTDPDGPGNKIREKVNEYLNFKCKNAFIDKKKIVDHGKIGVAEAELVDIVEAIKNAVTFEGNNGETIS